jgi:glycerophosphoryl diester phosphodiesterase
MPLLLDRLFLRTVDTLYGLWPAPCPPRERLQACRVISHRGNGTGRLENTVAAFEVLRGSGIFGIEFDVRWTRDLVPVVFHDPDLNRLFGETARLADLDWAGLRRHRPEIPDLYGFVRRFTDAFHLMAELKFERYPDPELQNRRLLEALAPALEQNRCHILCLKPQLFSLLPGIRPAQTLGIARINTNEISAEALASGRAGFAGHYAALGRAQFRRHHAAGQIVGCGFPNSRAVFYRMVSRGADLIFSDHAVELERWRRMALGLPDAHASRNSSTARL